VRKMTLPGSLRPTSSARPSEIRAVIRVRSSEAGRYKGSSRSIPVEEIGNREAGALDCGLTASVAGLHSALGDSRYTPIGLLRPRNSRYPTPASRGSVWSRHWAAACVHPIGARGPQAGLRPCQVPDAVG
jgi:hypothetical protein